MTIQQDRVLQANEIALLIGMPERRLAKFIESPGYGIAPSVRLKAGRGAPRLYNLGDLFSIAVAWWLFQAGLRSQVIGRILKSRDVSKSIRDSQGWTQQAAKRRFIVVKREMASSEPPLQEVGGVGLDEVIRMIESPGRFAFEVLPIGTLLFELWEKLR